MTILVTKLATGEELIGEFTDNADGTYKIVKPVVMQVAGVDPATGGLSVHMLPYMISDVDGNVNSFRSDACMFLPQPVSSSVAEQYTAATSSIQIVSALPGQ